VDRQLAPLKILEDPADGHQSLRAGRSPRSYSVSIAGWHGAQPLVTTTPVWAVMNPSGCAMFGARSQPTVDAGRTVLADGAGGTEPAALATGPGIVEASGEAVGVRARTAREEDGDDDEQGRRAARVTKVDLRFL